MSAMPRPGAPAPAPAPGAAPGQKPAAGGGGELVTQAIQQGFTYEDIGKALNVPGNLIQSLEKGQVPPPPEPLLTRLKMLAQGQMPPDAGQAVQPPAGAKPPAGAPPVPKPGMPPR